MLWFGQEGSLKEGSTIQLTDQISAEVLSIDDEGLRTIRFNPDLDNSVYDDYKFTPFPPYIEQNEKLSEEYQTIYAQPASSGASKAAPTAGLHFTDQLIERIENSSVGWAEVTCMWHSAHLLRSNGKY
ncbi:MAG: S-adenosylmethionine:tRNA ribosyltransferase-isomerase [Balneolaceae bacterium]|nr:S-adenosylmethionine:tRNA ribosyltransferase-isomerase [Balneolaceae bacterium]